MGAVMAQGAADRGAAGHAEGSTRLRGRADRLGELGHSELDQGPRQLDDDDQSGGGSALRGLGSREALARRLERLPPAHPSSLGDGARADRAVGDRPVGDRPVGDRRSGGGDPADDPERGYWSQVERFDQLWDRHTERWPGETADASTDASADRLRPGDPEGSWRGRGDRYLSPEQNAMADQLIAMLRAPEHEITKQLQQIEQENPHRGYLAGLQHRLKGDTRLKEKIADKMGVKIGASPADVVSTINDAVRYTFCFSRDEYMSGCGDIGQRLESAGYRMTYAKNYWISDSQYKGINSRWETAAGDRFEMQFHTPESLHAKEHLTHRSYDRLRCPDTSWVELAELETYQSLVSAAIPEPTGVAKVAARKDLDD
jgi:hypothetical protein